MILVNDTPQSEDEARWSDFSDLYDVADDFWARIEEMKKETDEMLEKTSEVINELQNDGK